jgi:hypothetical protein
LEESRNSTYSEIYDPYQKKMQDMDIPKKKAAG